MQTSSQHPKHNHSTAFAHTSRLRKRQPKFGSTNPGPTSSFFFTNFPADWTVK
ncbi:hypothetical protein Ancab_009018, partial [Ancistrocladus abbreviatus]